MYSSATHGRYSREPQALAVGHLHWAVGLAGFIRRRGLAPGFSGVGEPDANAWRRIETQRKWHWALALGPEDALQSVEGPRLAPEVHNKRHLLPVTGG